MSNSNRHEERTFSERQADSFINKVYQALISALIAVVITAFVASLPWTTVAIIIGSLLAVSFVLIWRANSSRRLSRRFVAKLRKQEMPAVPEINDELFKDLYSSLTESFKQKNPSGGQSLDSETLRKAREQEPSQTMDSKQFVSEVLKSSVTIYSAIYVVNVSKRRSQPMEDMNIGSNIQARKILEILVLLEAGVNKNLGPVEWHALQERVGDLNEDSVLYLRELVGLEPDSQSISVPGLISSYRNCRIERSSREKRFSLLHSDVRANWNPLLAKVADDEKIRSKDYAQKCAQEAYLGLDLAMKSYHSIGIRAFNRFLDKLSERAADSSWKSYGLSMVHDESYQESFTGALSLSEVRVLLEIQGTSFKGLSATTSALGLIRGMKREFHDWDQQKQLEFLKDNMANIRCLINLHASINESVAKLLSGGNPLHAEDLHKSPTGKSAVPSLQENQQPSATLGVKNEFPHRDH